MSDPVFEFLLEQGTSIAIMGGMLWVLIKKIFSQYENRIEALEVKEKLCSEDRVRLHEKIDVIRQDHIDSLKGQVQE